jgi:hypothetical protein
MPAKRIRATLRQWMCRRVCDAEQQEMLVLLDRVVQNSQGLLLQLQASCDLVPRESSAREELNAVLKKAEALLEELREEADIHTRRLRGHQEVR